MKERWKYRLKKESSYNDFFNSLDLNNFLLFIQKKRLTSQNHDTGLAIDWPHFCLHATTACGGKNGYCYTFSGFQATKAHDQHVAMVDSFARRFPEYFAEKVAKEVTQGVCEGKLSSKNLRYSGSGETHQDHIPALSLIIEHGIHLWGFTRNIDIAIKLNNIGARSIFSVDCTTSPSVVKKALQNDIPIGYVSSGVDDLPSFNPLVIFPCHRGGNVNEVADHPSLCPKVLYDFYHSKRPAGSCQFNCLRCHLKTKS